MLELGPGPGRFTPILRERPRTLVVGVDLSRAALGAARRRARRGPALATTAWVQGAGEALPLADGSVAAAVAFGNIVGFASVEGPAVLGELARVTRPGGRLLVDFVSPAAALREFFYLAARQRLLPRILRRPEYYLIDRVLATGFQPLDPRRLANWEFRFYHAEEAERVVARAGFRVEEVMGVGPIAGFQDEVAAIARRASRTWTSLLRLEEAVGRDHGSLEAGDGFLVRAVRR